ncbi:MAG TPA: DUF1385 domain-containing protein [Polyangiaceae bacterium]|nr:DUF1385 domain-containing protein [Polyangiaceae bacterium]
MSASEQRPYIGGQAVIEGVMMRSPRSFSIVVRRKSGELVVRERPVSKGAAPGGPWQWPFLRGVASLVEAVKLGSEALRFSSEIYERDHFDAPPTRLGAAGSAMRMVGSAFRAFAYTVVALASGEHGSGGGGTSGDGGGSSADGARRLFSFLTIGFAIVLFVVLPQTAAELGNRGLGVSLDLRSPLFQLETGAFKLLIIVSYLLLIRRVPEIKRVFQYHGAEHKTISTYEAGEELLVANARQKTTLHPRCGTTFLIMVAFVSVIVFSAVAPLLPHFHVSRVVENLFLIVLKLPFLPVIAAVTFEIQRIFARYCTTGVLRSLLWPGFLVQKITTIEPDDDQLEVALASLKATLWREHALALAPEAATDRTFLNFAALSADPGYGKAA